jgi:hypothetical protein
MAMAAGEVTAEAVAVVTAMAADGAVATTVAGAGETTAAAGETTAAEAVVIVEMTEVDGDVEGMTVEVAAGDVAATMVGTEEGAAVTMAGKVVGEVAAATTG